MRPTKTADGVCEDCYYEGQVTTIQGERDSFGCEYITLCPECMAKLEAGVEQAREERLQDIVAKTPGEEDADYYVSALGNRDTVDDCRIVRGKTNAAMLLRRYEETAADRGDYLYSHAIRVATPADREAVAQHQADIDQLLYGCDDCDEE